MEYALFSDNKQKSVVPINVVEGVFAKLINCSAYNPWFMVYLRSKTFKRKKDATQRTYYYLVEAKRISGKVRQKVVRYLGTADTIYKDYQKLDKTTTKNKQ